ncbi:predicted protein [Nematostella vectensis]|uniref:tRNA wybutosine-synthesizing protein 3 homolog n=1 Tax=Nematostella vectensis TaxID=45351 RepID=A7RZ41_NEMVE|nr:predicted protein [Nematostella vectensis]|eukprot:XP_001635353.1 predicted protein [Nematostella vectensis]
MAAFMAQKQQTLSQADLSKKGSIDEPIVNLVDYINGLDAFFTTSSCSGRISVFTEVLLFILIHLGFKFPSKNHYKKCEVPSLGTISGFLRSIMGELQQSKATPLRKIDYFLDALNSSLRNGGIFRVIYFAVGVGVNNYVAHIKAKATFFLKLNSDISRSKSYIY